MGPALCPNELIIIFLARLEIDPNKFTIFLLFLSFRARELPILEAMCNKLDKEWEELIGGLKEREKILKEATSFWKARDSFEWQCKTWIRHLNDFLRNSRNK